MAASVYDQNAEFYVDFVDRALAAAPDGGASLAAIVDCLGARLAGARVCDLCCGEGYAGRRLLALGAREVVGIDLSQALIEAARRRAPAGAISYRVDDVRSLETVEDAGFDVAVCQLAMMDVADHRAMFAAVRRVLAARGAFVFSMLHPCFEPPRHVRDAPPHLLDAAGVPEALAIRRYATEGHWNSGGDGVRGRMGAYHRTLSTYVNDLLASGFAIERLQEPLAGPVALSPLFAEVPTVLVIAARAV